MHDVVASRSFGRPNLIATSTAASTVSELRREGTGDTELRAHTDGPQTADRPEAEGVSAFIAIIVYR